MDFNELVCDYINNGTTKVLTERSKHSYLSRLPMIKRYFESHFGKADHTTLTVSNIRAYQRWRDTQIGNVQKEKEARIFKIMITRGVKNYLISKDFSDQLYKYKATQTKKSKTVIDPSRLQSIFDRAQEVLSPKKFLAFYLSHALMLRPSELLSIETENIDLKNKMIRIKGTKNDTADDAIPLSDKAVSLIEPLIQEKGKLFNYSYAWLHAIYMWLNDYCGIIDKDITPHKARKNMATYLINKGVDVKSVQTLGRWSSPKVLLDIYAQSSPETLRKAVNLL